MPAKKKTHTRKRRKKIVKKSSPIKKTNMAHRKKTTRRRRTATAAPHRRRRRSSVSGVGKAHADMGQMIPAVIAAVGSKILISKLASKINPKILAGGQVVVGFMLPRFVKQKWAAGVGIGLMITGAVSGLQSFGVISGLAGMIGDDDSLQLEAMSGLGAEDRLAILAGQDDEFSAMNGIDSGIFSGSTDLNVLAGTLGYMDDDSLGDMDDY